MSSLYAGIYAPFLALFGLLCYFAHQFPYFPGDVAISLWLQGIGGAFLSLIMQGASYISSLCPAIIIVAMVFIGVFVSGRRLEAIFIAALPSLAELLSSLKLVIGRPRPTAELVQVLGNNSGFSFPSGHVTYAVAFYGFLFYLTPRLVKQPVAAGALQSLLVILILLTMASRVYLGAHWPSDTLGSLFLSGLILAPAIALYHNYAKGQT